LLKFPAAITEMIQSPEPINARCYMLAAMKIVQNYVDLVANISVKKSVRNTSPGSV
jgi:hypothetical protein